MTIDELTEELYKHYCQQVGGKAFNGDPLPDWAAFTKHPDKQVQVNAWYATAQLAAVLVNTYKITYP